MKSVFSACAIIAVALAISACGMANMTTPSANEFDVVIVGDSIYDLHTYIHDHLTSLTGHAYKDYSRSGDTISYISDQYDTAIGNNPNIRTIIMDAGGNDILMDVYWSQACQSGTMTVSSSCKSYINGVLDDVEDLWAEMDADGIESIIHTGYYYLKTGTVTFLLYGGTRLNGAVKYADEQLAISAALSAAECFFVDPRSAFSGHSSYIISDGIHPSDSGGSVMAQLIYNVMLANSSIYRGN